MLVGQVMPGGWLSRTVTVNAHAAALLLVSVAVHATTVAPCGKRLPDGGTHWTITPAQSSEAVRLNVTCASHAPGAVNAMMSPGQVICGCCWSRTITVNLH